MKHAAVLLPKELLDANQDKLVKQWNQGAGAIEEKQCWEAALGGEEGGEMLWLLAPTPFNLWPMSFFVKTQPEDSWSGTLGNTDWRAPSLPLPESWAQERQGMEPTYPSSQPQHLQVYQLFPKFKAFFFPKVLCSFNCLMPCCNGSAILIHQLLLGGNLYRTIW